MNRQLSHKNQKGAVLTEYVMALGILIVVFVVIGLLLQFTAVRVARKSIESVKEDVPCRRGSDVDEEMMSGDECK